MTYDESDPNILCMVIEPCEAPDTGKAKVFVVPMWSKATCSRCPEWSYVGHDFGSVCEVSSAHLQGHGDGGG